ncbi:hypothetical protein ABEG17_08310 [Pedococcus sp. KACC 23699]|uniref:HK97 gp10 family phage protein n=1 Tax=Pedococcus sp. KACC 23699 TaxID=3149228 RepID=A0AAU7JZ08_9MICO
MTDVIAEWQELVAAGCPGASTISVKKGMFGRKTLRGYSIEWGTRRLWSVGGAPDAEVPDFGVLAEDGGFYQREKGGDAPYLRTTQLLSDGRPVAEVIGERLRPVIFRLAFEHLKR